MKHTFNIKKNARILIKESGFDSIENRVGYKARQKIFDTMDEMDYVKISLYDFFKYVDHRPFYWGKGKYIMPIFMDISDFDIAPEGKENVDFMKSEGATMFEFNMNLSMNALLFPKAFDLLQEHGCYPENFTKSDGYYSNQMWSILSNVEKYMLEYYRIEDMIDMNVKFDSEDLYFRKGVNREAFYDPKMKYPYPDRNGDKWCDIHKYYESKNWKVCEKTCWDKE